MSIIHYAEFRFPNEHNFFDTEYKFLFKWVHYLIILINLHRMHVYNTLKT